MSLVIGRSLSLNLESFASERKNYIITYYFTISDNIIKIFEINPRLRCNLVS